ncbi:hypothetical protein SDC9_111822 [bioreactor metagenome]|uniref:Uncharacterized protein n=1 Tax=bioreactor metagenome TaxID=1076179 RepID=A0A645BK66_9ZZZZ
MRPELTAPPLGHGAGPPGSGVELAEPSLAGDELDISLEGGDVLDDEPVLIGDVDHPVVAGDHHPDVVGQLVADALEHRVDPAQLVAPFPRIHPAGVAGVVQFPFVRVHQAARTGGGSIEDRRHPTVLVALVVDRVEDRAGQGDLGQPGPLEPGRGDHADGDARLGEGPQPGRMRLQGNGIVLPLPGEHVEEGTGDRVPGRVSDDAVPAGDQPGAEAGEARHRGRGQAGGEAVEGGVITVTAQQGGQVRGVLGVVGELQRPQAVDQHHDPPVRLRQSEAHRPVGPGVRRGDPEPGADRRQQVAQCASVVLRQGHLTGHREHRSGQ